jgi:uncharacterized protein (DUF433 family)
MDAITISKKLDSIESEIRHLRTLLRWESTTALQPAHHPYIESIPTILGGEPIIAGTRTPVRAIVEHWKFGDSPEEIARKLPYLRLAQIFDALSYYDDHRDEIEHHIVLNQVPVDE